MSKEVHFKKHWRTIGLALSVVTILELLLISTEMDKIINGDLVNGLFAPVLVFILGIGLSWSFIMQQFVRYYDDGLSFIKYFQRKFVYWKEIERIGIFQHKIIRLESQKFKFNLLLSEYKEPEKLTNFIKEKLLQDDND